MTAHRAARPQAAVALPPLSSNATQVSGTNGHTPAAPAAVATATVPREASQPILPPRTTARSMPAARPSIWRSWPMLVIVLAAIAIVTATVIMVMPPDRKKARGKMSTPPAPERMQTNPLPEQQSQIDPWAPPPGTVPQAPDPQLAVPQPAPPSPMDPDVPDPDDDDIWGGLGTPRRGNVFGSGGGAFMINVLDRACKRLATCPDVDQSALSIICEQVAMIPKPPVPRCAAAQRCLEAIDRLSCSQAQFTSPMSMFTLFDDCSAADNC